MNKAILVTLAACSVISSPIFGSEISDTKVNRLMMDASHGSKLFISVDGDPVRSNCHTNVVWDYVIDVGTEFGKKLHVQLLTAQTAQKNVRLVGTEACDLFSDTETLRRVEIY